MITFLRDAVDRGVTLFDTAEVMPFHRRSGWDSGGGSARTS